MRSGGEGAKLKTNTNTQKTKEVYVQRAGAESPRNKVSACCYHSPTSSGWTNKQKDGRKWPYEMERTSTKSKYKKDNANVNRKRATRQKEWKSTLHTRTAVLSGGQYRIALHHE